MLNRNWASLFVMSFGLVALGEWPAVAQVTGVEGTVVTPSGSPSGSTLTITGGKLSGSKTNLFHSFQNFNLATGVTADFDATPAVGNPAIANIFARVLGGNASYIDGLVKVSNGTSNLYFINPAGILTGVNARIEVPGSFTATTSDRLGFTGGLLNSLEANPTVSGLEGVPIHYQFSLTTPGMIVNEGSIKVGPDNSTPTNNGQGIRLLGGIVLNTGTLSVPSGASDIAPGRIEIVTVNGPKTVSFDSNGVVIQPGVGGPAPLLTLQLPSTVLQSRSPNAASQISVAADGTISLTGAPLVLEPGTVAIAGNTDISTVFQPTVKGLVSNGGLFINADGNVQITAIQIKDESNLGNFDPPPNPLRSPIVIQSNAEIRTGNLETTAGDIILKTSGSSGNIITARLTTGGQLNSRNQSRIQLISPSGNIQVNTLDSGSGGILVQAGTTFRALGTTQGASGGGNFIIDDPGLTDYLVSLGYNRQEIDNADLRLGSSAKVSIIARPSVLRNTGDTPLLDGYKAPVVIQYGDRAQTLVDTTFSFNTPTDRTGRILIQGDSQQAFRMGLAYDGQPPFVLNNFPGDPIPAQNAITSPNIASLTTGSGGNGGFFYLRDGRPLVYSSAEFPATASGLVGGLQVGSGTDSSLYSSVQSQIFNPVIRPVDPPVQPPVTPTVPSQPDTSPTAPSFQATAATQSASTVAQRDAKTGKALCPTGQPTGAIALRSAEPPQPAPSPPAQPNTQTLQAQTDPCQQVRPDNDKILQLLQDGPNLDGIPQLRPEDLRQ